MEDTCKVCAGVQTPSHKHVCDTCGRDAGNAALVKGVDGEVKRFYCDKYCMAGADDAEGDDNASLLVREARKLKVQLQAAGVDWRKV